MARNQASLMDGQMVARWRYYHVVLLLLVSAACITAAYFAAPAFELLASGTFPWQKPSSSASVPERTPTSVSVSSLPPSKKQSSCSGLSREDPVEFAARISLKEILHSISKPARISIVVTVLISAALITALSIVTWYAIRLDPHSASQAAGSSGQNTPYRNADPNSRLLEVNTPKGIFLVTLLCFAIVVITGGAAWVVRRTFCKVKEAPHNPVLPSYYVKNFASNQGIDDVVAFSKANLHDDLSDQQILEKANRIAAYLRECGGHLVENTLRTSPEVFFQIDGTKIPVGPHQTDLARLNMCWFKETGQHPGARPPAFIVPVKPQALYDYLDISNQSGELRLLVVTLETLQRLTKAEKRNLVGLVNRCNSAVKDAIIAEFKITRDDMPLQAAKKGPAKRTPKGNAQSESFYTSEDQDITSSKDSQSDTFGMSEEQRENLCKRKPSSTHSGSYDSVSTEQEDGDDNTDESASHYYTDESTQ